MKNKLSLFALAGLISGGIFTSPILTSSARAWVDLREDREELRRDFEELHADEREEHHALEKGHIGEARAAEIRKRQDLERIREDERVHRRYKWIEDRPILRLYRY